MSEELANLVVTGGITRGAALSVLGQRIRALGQQQTNYAFVPTVHRAA